MSVRTPWCCAAWCRGRGPSLTLPPGPLPVEGRRPVRVAQEAWPVPPAVLIADGEQQPVGGVRKLPCFFCSVHKQKVTATHVADVSTVGTAARHF